MMYALLLAVFIAPYPDGTLVFLKNSNAIVQRRTNSDVSHVAMIVNLNDIPYIYEATPPVVRRIPLDDWLAEVSKENLQRETNDQITVWIAEPDTPYNSTENTRLKTYLDTNLGRKYSILSYVTEKPRETTYCGEYTTNALERAGVFYSDNPCREAPIDVWNKTKKWYKSPIKSN